MSSRISEGRVVVTGASRGIGRAVARLLSARGAKVLAVGRDATALRETEETAVGEILPLVADVADPEQRLRVIERAVRELGGLEGLVSCAGIVRYEAAPNVSESSLRAQLEVNLVAPFLLAQDAARVMMAHGTSGSIVNVSSTLSQRPAPSTLAYAASKAALDATTRGLALELAPYGIRVNGILPGIVDTEMVRVPRLREGEAAPSGQELASRIAREMEALRKLHPMGRLGTAEEVAQLVVEVLDTPWMTGSLVVLDGGISI